MSSPAQTPAEVWTVRRMMKWMTDDFAKRELASPRLDAELLVAHALGVARVRLYMDMDRPLVPGELRDIRELVARRRAREPVAYIIEKREFYGRTFTVSPDVLIPRPDSETLVERALELIDNEKISKFWDVCTGSGAIGLAIAAERKEVRAMLSDISRPALDVAKHNAESLGLRDRVTFVEGDLLAPFAGQSTPLVCVNPPYISSEELAMLEPEVRDYEPRLALEAEDAGMAILERLLRELPAVLVPGGAALIECGHDQAKRLREIARSLSWQSIKVHNDLGGIGRVIEVRKAG